MSNYSKGFEKLGVDLRSVRGNASICPSCSHTRKKSKERCMSINLESGFYKCNHCDFAGRVDSNDWISKTYYSDNNVKSNSLKINKSKTYANPNNSFQKLSTNSLEFLKSRGITEQVAIRNRIGENKNGDIAFTYYNDKSLIACKFRKVSGKSFYQIPNCKPILYKLNDIKKIPYAIICEGELDALSWEVLGLTGAVSIDKGAPNKGGKIGTKLDCLRTCYNFLKDKEDIYISVDNDENGNYLKEILINRFGRDKCFIISYPDDCKDANDVLIKYGIVGLEKCFNNCKKVPVSDIQKAEDVYDEILEDFENGYDKGEPCGFEAIESGFSWIKHFVYLWTGIPNHGKSAFVSFLMMLKSINSNTKWAIFSPEHAPAKVFYKNMISLFTGKSLDKNSANAITREEIILCKNFISDNFIFIYPEELNISTENDAMQTPKWILDKISELALCEGIGGFLIDPWNQLDHIYKDIKREDQYLSHWLKQFKKVSQMHNLFCNIVVHPKKMNPDMQGIVRKPTAYDISGGAMWSNKADVITVIHRDKFYTDKMDNSVFVDVQKAKEQHRFGQPRCNTVFFEALTGWYKGEFGSSPMEGIFEKMKKSINGEEIDPIKSARPNNLEEIPF